MTEDIDLEIEGLNRYRQSLLRKRKRIKEINQQFLKETGSESDNFRKRIVDNINEHAVILEDLFLNLEMLIISNSALKIQLGLLRDILQSIPQIKENAKIQLHIDQIFRRYDELYKQQQDSFKKSRAD